MRFRIDDRRWRVNTPYRLHTVGTVTEVTAPILPKSIHYGELLWTWPDGARYTLRVPMSRKGQRPEWQVCCGDDLISIGRWGDTPGWQAFLRGKGRPVEWELDGQVLIVDEAGCCGGEVRSDGRLLAKWTRRARYWEGIWRNSLCESEIPIVLAVILASIHDE